MLSLLLAANLTLVVVNIVVILHQLVMAIAGPLTLPFVPRLPEGMEFTPSPSFGVVGRIFACPSPVKS